MASLSTTPGAVRHTTTSTENDPAMHTRKRVSRALPSTLSLSDRRKQHQLRERQRALRHVHLGQDLEMGEPSPLAMADPWNAENSIPIFNGITLPRQLSRAAFRMPRTEALAAVEPGLADTNIEYIKDCLELRGEQMYAALKNTTILSLHKPHGPHYFPTSARVRVTHAHADLPTHLLAVRSNLPAGRDLADDPSSFTTSNLNAPRPSAHYVPIHALTLAVYAPLVPSLPPSCPSEQLPDDVDLDSPSDPSADVTLPVVIMRIPSPRTFGMLIAVLYSQRYDNLVKVLLGIPLIPPRSSSSDPRAYSQSTLFTQSIFSQLFSPLGDLPSPKFPSNTPSSPITSSSRTDRLVARLTQMSRLLALGYLNRPSSRNQDKNTSGLDADTSTGVAAAADALLRRTRLTQAIAANARALGVCDLAFWGSIDVAWAVLLGALGFLAGSGPMFSSSPVSASFGDALAQDSVPMSVNGAPV